MAAHVEGGMVRSGFRPVRLGGSAAVRCHMSSINDIFLRVDRGGFIRLLYAVTIKTLVKNLALVGEVTRAGLVALRRMTALTVALTKLNLWLFETLSENNIVKK